MLALVLALAGGIGCIIWYRLSLFGNSSTASEDELSTDYCGDSRHELVRPLEELFSFLQFIFPYLLFFFISSSVSMSYFIIAIPCVSIWENTQHAFHISYCHTEWYLLSSLSKNGDGICKQSAVKLNSKLDLCYELPLLQAQL